MKEYQTTCKANQKRFFQNPVNTLYSTDNPNLWNNWKNCGDEFETKTPALKNGIVLEKYYIQIKRIKRINNSNKKLKNGKAPGLDMVSNETTKASFEILQEACIKLFNFVMTLGIVPSIWCKGLISPIHKSGDPLNPENYRPICVLSCI